MNIKEIINFEINNILVEFKTKFNLEKFKSIETLKKKIIYATKHLKIIGVGSSRIVFLLSNRFVLKVAKPVSFKIGVAQNEAEIEIYTNPKIKPIVAKIYDFDPNYNWIISELVRPIKDKHEFFDITNISQYELYHMMDDIEHYLQYNNHNKANFNKFFQHFDADIKNNKFLYNLLELQQETDLLIGDLIPYEHWGKTLNNRIVLLDYGTTNEIYNKHYKVNLYKK